MTSRDREKYDGELVISTSHILCVVLTDKIRKTTMHTVDIYTPNSIIGRRNLSQQMKIIIRDRLKVPWIITENFNTPINSSRKLGGSLDAPQLDGMKILQNFINSSRLLDLNIMGGKFK